MDLLKDKKQFLRNMSVPLLFIVIISVGIPLSKYTGVYLLREGLTRLVRNSFLVISLLIPVMAGMGINFAITLGAMAGQIGIIFSQDWGLTGVGGLFVAMALATPIAILLGAFAGHVLNKARGREMITSMILSFLISGFYQFFMLFFCGGVIKFHDPNLILSRGYGVISTVTLKAGRAFDDFIKFELWPGTGIYVPVFTIFLIFLACLFTVWFRKTKLGHDMRSVGQDQRVSNDAGMAVDHIRVQSIVISTVMACYGQIIYLQNIGTMNTTYGADQVSLFAAAALLVGGASVSRASLPNVFIGVLLFHMMFIVMPVAGKTLTGNAMIGEYFRSFISYGVVALALIMHSWARNRDLADSRKQMRKENDDKSRELKAKVNA